MARSLQQSSELPLATTNSGHLGGGEVDEVKPQVETQSATSLRSDGNNVDIDQEMTALAKNGIYYNALVKEISSQLGILRMVISEKP